jgi:hypothetical protein
MLRYSSAFLLSALLLLLSPLAAAAQWPYATPAPPPAASIAGLSGTYINQSNGGTCYVYRQGRTYEFVNENGTPAWFAFTAPGQLQMVSGSWDPNIVVTVSRDASGRPLLRFDAPYTPTGYWAPAY